MRNPKRVFYYRKMNQQLTLAIAGQKQEPLTISSLQIAEITGKDHAHVMRDIRKTLDEVGIDQSRFGSIFKDSYNRSQACYLLPRRECDLVVSGYSVKYRLAIIDRWQELEAQVAAPALPNYAEALRLLADKIEENAALNLSVASLTPKADALDRLADADGLFNITNAAKMLQIQPKKLFSYLDQNGWTYRRVGNGERVPYQNQIQCGRMTMKAHTIKNPTTGEEKVHEQALITPKGIAFLSKVFSTEQNQ